MISDPLITIDVDWAPDFAIDPVANALLDAGVSATWFITHASPAIVRGVTIGRQCVIAANSLVNRDVADRTIVGGSPAKRLGRVRVEGDDVRLDYD